MDRVFEEPEHRGLGWGGLSKMEGRRETVHLAREKRLSEDRVHHPILAKPRGARV